MQTQIKLGKRIFLSGTYEDQVDCIEEIKSKLGEQGVSVVHFKEGGFPNGIPGVHPHDLCLKNVEDTQNYLLIVGEKAGSEYEGEKKDYHGLTVTHAEFRTALAASTNDDHRRLFLFIRQKVLDTYSAWKSLSEKARNEGSWPAEPKVYSLIEDIDQNKQWRISFRDSRHLKELIKGILPKIILKAQEEIINLDTLSSYIREKYPDRPPIPAEDLYIVTLELGRYGCNTISQLENRLKMAEKALLELDKEFIKHGKKGIHGGGAIRNSLWMLDDVFYEKRIVGFTCENEIDRKRFRHLIEK